MLDPKNPLKLGKLPPRPFKKKAFVLPTKYLIALSRKQPVRLILDYVLVSRTMDEITFPFFVLNPNTRRLEPTMFILFVVAERDGRLYPVHLDFWAQEQWAEGDGLYLTKIDVAKAAIVQLQEQGLEIAEVLFDAGFCSQAMLQDLAKRNAFCLGHGHLCRTCRQACRDCQCASEAGSAALLIVW